MNNSKKTLAAGAGAGVLALALLGGGTFAAWSDYQTITGNEVGAGHLTLTVGHDGAMQRYNPGNLAPGQNKFQDMHVASNAGDSVPSGALYVTLQNLNDKEQGCGLHRAGGGLLRGDRALADPCGAEQARRELPARGGGERPAGTLAALTLLGRPPTLWA